MPLTTHPLPFGLRDVKLSPETTEGTYGTGVDLPVARTLTFTETEEYETLEGDDSTAGSHGAGPTVEWELESGGLPFEAFRVMAGGTVTETGVTPAMKKTFSKLRTDARPYFKAEGQAISDSGGDVHAILYRCKADGDLEGEFGQGAFFLLAASGHAFGHSTDGKLYDFVQNETAIAIT